MNALLLALAVNGAAAAPPPAPPFSERARAALGPYKQALREALTQALAASPEQAIEVCSRRAPELAREASRGGLTVGRAALKLRNPANAPRPWLVPVMQELARARPGSDASREVVLPDGRRAYAEAIWTAPLCLTCHGPSLSPGVEARLKAAYPADQARGFQAGDFRGVFWAEEAPR